MCWTRRDGTKREWSFENYFDNRNGLISRAATVISTDLPMETFVKKGSKMRKNGRTVFVTSVVFDAQVFAELCTYIDRDIGHRSAIVNEAVRYALNSPGWIEATVKRLWGVDLVPTKTRQPPSSNSRIHARNAADAPATRRSPASRPPSSKDGEKTLRK